MKLKINFWSFIFSLICIALFFVSVSSKETLDTVTNLLHTHPLYIVLTISFITFIFGLIGLSASTNWKLLLRGISTIVITLGLCIVIIIITVMGNIFKFT
ncbi:hypothetical protein LGK97_13960 [Clostridium sp. CS001]|uniref:hypothetical protein n=1 Tax=Clostridium sp. CS001 TaxID=2880648 RepID=UPI001CF3DB4E|nr:hypothetical protein [Clostridium sp. CS001]MCB2290847.1 hypothetical protein [Clostridium sp. CS001]